MMVKVFFFSKYSKLYWIFKVLTYRVSLHGSGEFSGELIEHLGIHLPLFVILGLLEAIQGIMQIKLILLRQNVLFISIYLPVVNTGFGLNTLSLKQTLHGMEANSFDY